MVLTEQIVLYINLKVILAPQDASGRSESYAKVLVHTPGNATLQRGFWAGRESGAPRNRQRTRGLEERPSPS